MSKIFGKGKEAYLNLFTYGEIEVDVAAEGNCHKCGNGDAVTIDISCNCGMIELCFKCIMKGKEEIALHLLKEFGKE